MVHVRMYAALAARERRRHRSDRPRLDRGPPPGRPGPARSRLGGRHSLPTAPISPPGDRTPTRGAHAAREAASRRRSPPPSALRALHARLRRCQRRRGPHRRLPRPPGGRYGRYGPPAASAADQIDALRRHRGGAVAALRPAPARQTGRGESYDGVGGSPGQRSGDGGGGQPRDGRARGHTHTHAAFFACCAHLARAAPAGGGEVGGGGDGGGGDARDEGRRDGAVGGRRDARRGACERGASSGGCQPWAGWGE